MSEPTERSPLSPEKIKDRRAKLVSFYKEQVLFLKHQRDYEAIITELDELAMRRMVAQMRMAQMQAPPPPDQDENSNQQDENEGKMPEVSTNNLQTKEQPNEPIPTLSPRKLKTT